MSTPDISILSPGENVVTKGTSGDESAPKQNAQNGQQRPWLRLVASECLSADTLAREAVALSDFFVAGDPRDVRFDLTVSYLDFQAFSIHIDARNI